MAIQNAPVAVAPLEAEEQEPTRFPMEEVLFEKGTLDEHRQRCRELFQRMDELYEDLKETSRRPALFANFNMELEQEYKEEIGRIVYEVMHKMKEGAEARARKRRGSKSVASGTITKFVCDFV